MLYVLGGCVHVGVSVAMLYKQGGCVNVGMSVAILYKQGVVYVLVCLYIVAM